MVTGSKQTKERKIEEVRILPLPGTAISYPSCLEAVFFIKSYIWSEESKQFVRFKIEVIYTDGVHITGDFLDNDSAAEFILNRAKGLI